MKTTTIEIVSFVHGLNDKVKLHLTEKVINESTANILLFSGHTIGFVNEIEKLGTHIKNKETETILELENINSDKINNCLYRISNGKLFSLNTNQLFSTSTEIEDNYELALRLLYEFETKRTFTVNGLNILVIQCGELNILKNHQKEENRAEFRLPNKTELSERFTKFLKGINIILNPIHTPMGNQGKMHQRRIYLSRNKRYYFSTSNTKENSNDLSLESLQYGFFDGFRITATNKKLTSDSISRIYEITK